ncbi:hypothetical protein KR018_005852 [Drosophila ironensis]|nr:hypothetical protein KR018_005852 [Drosophila ironensis]
MMPKALILFAILVSLACSCSTVFLPNNAYLPPAREQVKNPDDQFGGDFLESNVDFPAIAYFLGIQQEYALDLPFEEEPVELLPGN